MQASAESARIQADLLDRQRALMLAQNVLEEIRYTEVFETGEDQGDFEDEDAFFRWRTEIRPNDRFDGLLDVAVTILWNDGREREYTLATQIAEPQEPPAGGAAQ